MGVEWGIRTSPLYCHSTSYWRLQSCEQRFFWWRIFLCRSGSIWKKVIEINLTGTFYSVKYSLPWLKKSKSVLLLTSSGAGVTGAGSAAPYSSSKGGTHGLTLWLENNLKDTKIRVHDILPGGIESPLKIGQLNEAFNNTGDKNILEQSKLALGKPEGVAKIVAFIASDDADYLRGSIKTR